MEKTVENWEGRISFQPPGNAKQRERMLDFVNQHFISNEPLNVAINICEPGYRMPWFDKFVGKYISEGRSLIAWDTITNEMVGVAILTECRKSPEPSESSDSSDLDQGHNSGSSGEEEQRWAIMPVKFGLILEFLESLATSVDLFNLYKVEKYIELFILCSHSTKRYPGLGTALTNEALKKAKNDGFSVCATEATSFFSQKIFTRIGFEVLKEVKFEEHKPHGKIIFPKHGMHDSVKLMVKRF